MVDLAIEKINNIVINQLNFQWLRSSFMTDYSQRGDLNYGHAVIDTTANLDQYLYSYGPMIRSQWECLKPWLSKLKAPTRWVDYGCGQGLAGLLINDITQGELLSMVSDIILIEPSSLALDRSTAIYQRLAPNAKVTSICKHFDDLCESEIFKIHSDRTLHIFSNSLDIQGFDPFNLLGKTLHTGYHTILTVSHDRDFNGGTPQIECVKAAFEDPTMANSLTMHSSKLSQFTCDNPSESKGVAWICEFEVK